MPDIEFGVTAKARKVLQITFKNTQSKATANPHIQLLQLPRIYFPSVDMAFRLVFYDPNTNAFVPAWIEGMDSNYLYIWVRIGQIGANSMYSIYALYFDDVLTLDGVNLGINPYLAANTFGLPYGTYDNGSKVFYAYWNFAGTSLPSGWSYKNNVSVNNGLYISATAYNPGYAWVTINTLSNFSQLTSLGFAVRALVYEISEGSSGGNDHLWFLGYGVSSSTFIQSAYGYSNPSLFGGGNTTSFIFKQSGGTTTLVSTSDSASAGMMYILYSLWYGTTLAWWRYAWPTYALQKNLSAGDSTYSQSSVQQFAVGINGPSSGTGSCVHYFDAIFDAPPNGIMPVVSAIQFLR